MECLHFLIVFYYPMLWMGDTLYVLCMHAYMLAYIFTFMRELNCEITTLSLK